jgi:hypothetical protein
VARKVRLSSDRESIEWCKADGFIESWGSRLWIKDIAALRFAPSLDTKVYASLSNIKILSSIQPAWSVSNPHNSDTSTAQ